MNLFASANETISGLSQAILSGETTSLAIVERCLAAIEDKEPELNAWVHVDWEGAIEQAKRCDQEFTEGRRRGALHGIPVGIKDIIDVSGWPTAAGFEPWTDRVAKEDANVVTQLREAGTVIVGKTVTTQFACYDPPATRNPWKIDRTPGGSSSGSAAAVAAGMCLAALGTQTGGSITRPASFCGTAGLKPSFGAVSLQGVVPLAHHLDHVGPLARCVADLNLIFDELIGDESSASETLELTSSSPRLGILHEIFDDLADAEMTAAISRATGQFGQAGATVCDLEIPISFDEIQHGHHIVMAAEAASFHEPIFAEQGHAYGTAIRTLVNEGLTMSVTDYVRARQHQTYSRMTVGECFSNVDALLCPAALGAAPNTTTTGNPAFNIPWSYTGLPTVTFPVGQSENGLPLGIQLVGRHGQDRNLLNVASWCERAIQTAGANS